MKRIIYISISFVLICTLIFINMQKVNATATWQTKSFETHDLGFGVTYDIYKGISYSDLSSETNGENRMQEIYTINVAKDAEAKVVVWEKSGCNNRWGLTTIEDIARDYEKTHPDKIVLAATNNWLAWTKDNNRGEIKSCQIAGGLNFRVRDLQGTKDSTEGSFGSGYSPSNNMLGFDYDGNAYFCDNWNSGGNYTDKLYVSFYENEITKEKLDIIVDKINDLPQENELAIIFPNYDGITDLTGYDAYRMDAIKMRYDNVIGTKEFIERDAFALGNFAEKVTTIDFTTNPNSYYFVSKNATFNALDMTGKNVLAQYELLGEYANVIGATSYFQRIVKDGEFNLGDIYTHPRTLFIIKEDGSYALSVVDGRDPDHGHYGMSYEEMAYFYKNIYRGYQVFNHDGGGSTCMVIRDKEGHLQVVNNPSDGNERGVANANLVVVDKDPFNISEADHFDNKITLNFSDIKDTVKTIKVSLNDEEYQVIDGVVTIPGLEAKTKYEINIKYQTNDEQWHDALCYVTKTAKHNSVIENLSISDITTSSFNFSFNIKDVDEVFCFGSVEINGKTYKLNNLSFFQSVDGLEEGKEYEIVVTIVDETFGYPDEQITTYTVKTLSTTPPVDAPTKPSKGLTIGIVAGCGFVLPVSICVVVYFIRKKKNVIDE